MDDAQAVATPPSGFTAVPGGDQQGQMGGYRVTLFYRVASQGDVGGNFQFSTQAGNSLSMIIVAYSGVAASPFGNVTAQGGGPQSINSATSPALAVGMFGNGGGGGGGGWSSNNGTTRKSTQSAMMVDTPISGGSSGSFGPSCSQGFCGGVLAVLLP
jgi:hypothetical protein